VTCWFVEQVPNIPPDMKKVIEWTHRLQQSADANVIYLLLCVFRIFDVTYMLNICINLM